MYLLVQKWLSDINFISCLLVWFHFVYEFKSKITLFSVKFSSLFAIVYSLKRKFQLNSSAFTKEINQMYLRKLINAISCFEWRKSLKVFCDANFCNCLIWKIREYQGLQLIKIDNSTMPYRITLAMLHSLSSI